MAGLPREPREISGPVGMDDHRRLSQCVEGWASSITGGPKISMNELDLGLGPRSVLRHDVNEEIDRERGRSKPSTPLKTKARDDQRHSNCCAYCRRELTA